MQVVGGIEVLEDAGLLDVHQSFFFDWSEQALERFNAICRCRCRCFTAQPWRLASAPDAKSCCSAPFPNTDSAPPLTRSTTGTPVPTS
jgi:hypothetical protein